MKNFESLTTDCIRILGDDTAHDAELSCEFKLRFEQEPMGKLRSRTKVVFSVRKLNLRYNTLQDIPRTISITESDYYRATCVLGSETAFVVSGYLRLHSVIYNTSTSQLMFSFGADEII